MNIGKNHYQSISKKLLKSGIDVIGIDNLNNYYDQKLKIDRIDHLKITSREKIYHIDKELAILQEKVDLIFEKKPEEKLQILNLINELEKVNEDAWINTCRCKCM